MPFITSDQIRDVSIKTVEGFLNRKVPLSEGLAKFASDLNLNSEQIHRAVEATNSIAYLKILSLSDDRTVEFPLCKYAEVMGSLTAPDLQKQASTLETSTLDIFNFVKKSTGEFEKTASEIIDSTELNDVEKQVYFIKLAERVKRDLQDLRDHEMQIGPELLKAAKDFSKDPQALEKLAAIVEDGKEFKKLSNLVYGVSQEYPQEGIFKEADLKNAKDLVGLLKKAETLVSDIKEKQAICEKSELLKQAFIGAIGRGIGQAIGSIASGAGKAFGSVAGNLAARTTNFAERKMTGAANTIRSAVGEAPKPVPPAMPARKLGLTAAATAAGAIAGDAVMYSPSQDKTTGRSKDVWNSLQREPNI